MKYVIDRMPEASIKLTIQLENQQENREAFCRCLVKKRKMELELLYKQLAESNSLSSELEKISKRQTISRYDLRLCQFFTK